MNAVFWSNSGSPGVWRSNLNGSGIIPVFTDSSTIGKYSK